jgi:hypothetical protein
MRVGVGTVAADKKKVQGIVVWPRPSRPEDVERLLASCSFMRQHLSPRFSEVSKPLRDSMHELHVKRSLGLGKRTGPRGAGPSEGKSDDATTWPAWWTSACEASFQAVKRMVSESIWLFVPDLEGAASGANPFHIYLDACSYGIGAGVFQKPTKDAQLLDHYQVLNVSVTSTKGEVEAAVRERRKKMERFNSADTSQFEEASATLLDVTRRKAYDAEQGLVKSRCSRVDLRPLGLFSKSLSKAQRAWTTWERELLAAVEIVQF